MSLHPIARTLRRLASVACALVLLAGCAYRFKEQEKAAAQTQPVDCATAEGDLRTLNSEKANVAEQIAMGVTAIVPAGLVIGLVTFTEGTKIKVAIGEYNKALDARIAQIQSTCGLK
jgi:hypothetical protein